MDLIFIVLYLFDIIICITLSHIFTRIYAKKKSSQLLLIASRIFLFCNFLLIFTIPYEIVIYKVQDNFHETEIVKNILRINYQIIFFFLLFSIVEAIPFITYYKTSGEFTFFSKLFFLIKNYFLQKILIPLVLMPILLKYLSQELIALLIFCFMSYGIVYCFFLLGLSIVKIPRNMYIYSNIDYALEYYEFKANKKKEELNKNNKEFIKYFFKCKETLKYINKIEEYLKNINNEKEEKEKIYENIANIQGNLLNEVDNDNNSKIINENNNNNNNNIKEENKENNNIDIEYRKHKSILNYKKQAIELYYNICKLIKKNNIEIVEAENEEPLKEYVNLTDINAKSKQLDKENERINIQINRIYKQWTFFKELSIDKNKKIDNNLNYNKIGDDDESLKEYSFIQTEEVSEKKIKFFRKYNKHLYLFLMIFFIIIGILIVCSELSISSLNINLSLLNLVFTKVSNPILIHILSIIFILFFFVYVSYSFGKFKTHKRQYILIEGNQTNSLGILLYCLELSTYSFPLSINIIKMIFLKDNASILLADYGDKIGGQILVIIGPYIPYILIIIIIYYLFVIKGRICKKKSNSFYVKSESRDKYIKEGKQFLMELNKKIAKNLKIIM